MKKLLISFLFAHLVFIAAPAAAADSENEISQRDRIMGAIMGVFVGDALGVGTHWYYDLDNLKKDNGEWISDYQDLAGNDHGRGDSMSQYHIRLLSTFFGEIIKLKPKSRYSGIISIS